MSATEVASSTSPSAVLTPEPPPTARRRLVLLVLGALSAIGPLSIDMYLPALPEITSEMLTGPAQVQLTLTACLIGVSLGQVVGGPLSDVRGRRAPLLVGIAGYAVASLLCAFAPSVYALVALRLAQGFTGGVALVIVRAIVRDLYDGAAIARIFASLMLVSGLAPILAPIAGAQLLTFTSWRGVFVALSAAGLALLAWVLWGVRESLPREARQSGGLRHTLVIFARLLRDRSFMACALAAGLGFAGMFAYISGSPFVLQEIYGVSPQTYSLLFGLNAFGLIAVSQIGGRITGRVPGARLVLIGLAVSLAGALGLLAGVTTGLGLPAVAAALFVMMCGAGLTLPGTGALALAGQEPQVAGSASALLGVLQFALGAVAAPLVGLAGTDTGVPMAVVMIVAAALALLVFVALRRGVSAG
ncbi:DHA1 family bicyclomycin/chloramphenicol resistance-like MFS transporter [Thermocatellispora tengchongensis]|uniref:DHA1 family bicyclomycin/chloramphenicol resistance-like MFS transporter n=1 Tax=Thermocatellispora tengchongensis TaxID=1073253 RepID=A0A840P3Q1_9ACTN|nr:multidrug effflux MFS transporter [Thermocatellispora tengchongensis]MBB5135924.1 DHA1 family bicyclomycin/chloramphenicol resistance-like MFS transporter [Thermocatellispora tengchongensis]